ncbi:MAG: hypothetical protein NTV36_02570 [Candidatus Staskawiczbacteria bacterium]|nr:hypothetical protein [Candidatus Staskawiczbacteria bacterium]
MEEINQYLNKASELDKLQKQLENFNIAIKTLEKQNERWAEMYAEESISKSLYDQKMKEGNKKIETLQKDIKTISQSLVSEEENKRRTRSVSAVYNQLKTSLENATYEVKRETLQKLVGKIVKTGDDLDIEFIFPFSEAKVPSNCDCSDNARMD